MPKEITLEKLTKIIELSQLDMFRKEIARQVGASPMTVFKYQKRFDLV